MTTRPPGLATEPLETAHVPEDVRAALQARVRRVYGVQESLPPCPQCHSPSREHKLSCGYR